MEEIYLKKSDHKWYSNKVDLSKYFKSYSESYSTIMKRRNMSLSNIFQSLMGNDLDIDKKGIDNFIQEMSDLENKSKTKLPELKTIEKKVKQKLYKQKKVPKISTLKDVKPGESVGTQHEDCEVVEEAGSSSKQVAQEQAGDSQDKCVKDKIKEIYESHQRDAQLSKPSLKVSKLRRRTKSKQPKYKTNILTTRRELILDNEADKSSKKNLKIGSHFIVSFRIHKPFAHRGDKSKVETFQQEIEILNHQSLTMLRDKIICQSDFQDVRGDVSHDPDSPATLLTRDKYKSAMFYFDNTFYIDERGDEDYSGTVRCWALPRGIDVGVTRNMGSTRVEDLRVRLGYPYVYMHQGNCEHLVIIRDARLVLGNDSLDSADYPRFSRISRPITKYCFTCARMPAKWIVVGCDRLPVDLAYMCEKCFKMYNYVDGKKIGNFKAYRYFQKNLLL